MYVPETNYIWLPLGIQMPPFYQSQRIQALNYGALGYILGHELTHGFDNLGSLFDKHGDYVNWWSDDTKKRFEEKQQCFVEQYANYSFQVLQDIPNYEGPTAVNGINTLGTSIVQLMYVSVAPNCKQTADGIFPEIALVLLKMLTNSSNISLKM